jgi:hypothetical protein
MRIALVLYLAGAAMLAYSCTLMPYKDEAAFQEQSLRLNAVLESLPGEPNADHYIAYRNLRQEMLTPKFKLQDYGISLLILSMGVLLSLRRGRFEPTTPKSRGTLIFLAFSLPFISGICHVFDLLQDSSRQELSPWANTIDTPAIAALFQLMVLMILSVSHLVFLCSGFHPQVPLRKIISGRKNWWLLSAATVTALFTVPSVLRGEYWYGLSGCLWIYFYLSLETAFHGPYAGHGDLENDGKQDPSP